LATPQVTLLRLLHRKQQKCSVPSAGSITQQPLKQSQQHHVFWSMYHRPAQQRRVRAKHIGLLNSGKMF
jgi:hypothetical protein